MLRSPTRACHWPLIPSRLVFMGEPRPQKLDLRDILPPLVGVFLIGALFIPAIKQLLADLFVWAVGLLSLAVIGLVARVWLRRLAHERVEAPTLMPIFIHNAEERAQF